MSEDVFITIIGAGVIGCAVAFELSQSIKKDIVVIEKNPRKMVKTSHREIQVWYILEFITPEILVR